MSVVCFNLTIISKIKYYRLFLKTLSFENYVIMSAIGILTPFFLWKNIALHHNQVCNDNAGLKFAFIYVNVLFIVNSIEQLWAMDSTYLLVDMILF